MNLNTVLGFFFLNNVEKFSQTNFMNRFLDLRKLRCHNECNNISNDVK